MNFKKLNLFILVLLFLTPVKSEELTISETANEYNFYSGTFDTIDKEGDDQTSLVGLEHKNVNLYRDTILGKFSPVSGMFISGNSSIYLYTGIQAEYGMGPLTLIPSFTPGYYEKGDGKDLGSALEFKSEIRLDINIFKGAKIGYSYNHISNNDWGNINPGIDNQQISFSKTF
tara:strand:- start:115 stop:633 length:519 start_codon:yes stop_codon:yes gene_type:complete